MTWLTWRQHRGEAFIVGGVLALLAVVVIVSGLAVRGIYDQLGVGSCLGSSAPQSCNDILSAFHQETGFWRGATLWLTLVPPLFAMLVGTPLVAREFEQGTFRLAWTQSVSRLRWLSWKLALVVGASLLVTALETALLTWWRAPFAQVGGRLDPQEFDVEGIVPFAYLAFAFALAIAAGALLRRTVAAMAVTVAGFALVRFPILYLLRPQYQPPLVSTWDPYMRVTTIPPTAWTVDGSWLDAAGHPLDDTQVVNACVTNTAHYTLQPGTPFTQCTHAHGWLLQLIWQPDTRYWLFQGIEAVIFVALALGLVALTYYWARRRLS